MRHPFTPSCAPNSSSIVSRLSLVVGASNISRQAGYLMPKQRTHPTLNGLPAIPPVHPGLRGRDGANAADAGRGREDRSVTRRTLENDQGVAGWSVTLGFLKRPTGFNAGDVRFRGWNSEGVTVARNPLNLERPTGFEPATSSLGNLSRRIGWYPTVYVTRG